MFQYTIEGTKIGRSCYADFQWERMPPQETQETQETEQSISWSGVKSRCLLFQIQLRAFSGPMLKCFTLYKIQKEIVQSQSRSILCEQLL